MHNYEKLAQALGISSEALLDLDAKMAVISGKSGVLEEISLSGPSFSTEELIEIDKKLATDYGGKLEQVVLKVFKPQPGFFIRKEKVEELLAKQPPQSLLEHFGYKNVEELLEKEGFASVVASLRFTQTEEWMHQFFDTAYRDLKPEDFEDRDVEIKVLDSKWLDIAQKFIGKKLHNVSHLKEFGVIFISPKDINRPGETFRNFLLLLHYLHEVPFYSDLFRKFSYDSDFIPKLQSLLRGDVLEESEILKLKSKKSTIWLIIQRYLAKDNPNDPRLHEVHVNPEAEHWYRVGQDFPKAESELGLTGIAKWMDSDWSDSNLIDLVMSMVANGEIKYFYHQREALWNRIFVGYFGRDKMNAIIEEGIVEGYIEF